MSTVMELPEGTVEHITPGRRKSKAVSKDQKTIDFDASAEQQRIDEAAQRVRLTYKGVRVKISGIPSSRKVSDGQKSQVASVFDANAATISMSSLLWDCNEPAVKALRAALSSASRLFHNPALTLPTAHDGLRMLRRDAITRFHQQMTECREEIAQRAAALKDALPDIIERERDRRGQLFNESDYRFDPTLVVGLSWSFPSIVEDQDLAEIDDSVYQDELRRVREDLQQSVRIAEQEMAEQLYSMLTTISLKLESDASGQPKKFKNTTISRIFEELDQAATKLKEVGIGGGPLAAVAENLRKTLAGQTAETLPETVRESGSYREHIREQCAKLADQVLASAVPTRRRNLLASQAAARRHKDSQRT